MDGEAKVSQRVGEWLLLLQKSVGLGTMSVLPSLHLVTCRQERLGELLLASPLLRCVLCPPTTHCTVSCTVGTWSHGEVDHG